MIDSVAAYFKTLGNLWWQIEATNDVGDTMRIEDAYAAVYGSMQFTVKHYKGKIIFVGNGGSAAIASHMAVDYAKNGGLAAIALNDAAMLTCLSNDYSYSDVFAKQIEMIARPGDIVVAISSSGKSASILNAVEAAKDRNCLVFTLSGFDADNPLRDRGDINFYVPNNKYGFVEITHLSLLHSINDLGMERSIQ